MWRKFLSKDEEHPSVIILIVKNERKLQELHDKLPFEHISFYEPDIGNQMTAIAVKPIVGEDREYFKRYQLLM